MEFKCLLAMAIIAAICTLASGQNQSQSNAATTPAEAANEAQTATVPTTDDDATEFNQTEIVLACNETFHTSMGLY